MTNLKDCYSKVGGAAGDSEYLKREIIVIDD